MSNPFKNAEFNKEAEYLAKKREEAIKYLGDRWLLAKSNYVTKKNDQNLNKIRGNQSLSLTG